MNRVIDMRKKRAGLIHDARALLDKAEEEKRAMSAEEEEQYDRIDDEIDKLEIDANRLEKQIERERALGEPNALPAAGSDSADDPKEARTLGDILEDRNIPNLRDTEEYRAAFASWLGYGREADLTAEEVRAMQADSDVGGGYLVAPQQMVLELLKEADAVAVFRQHARIHQLETAASLGAVSLDDDADDWDWTTELRTGDTTELGFGKRELRPHPLAKRALISNTLLRKAMLGPERIVLERLAYKLAMTQEKAYLVGDGNQKPLGVFVNSRDGITDARDVPTGKTDDLTTDGLIDAKFALKQAYWPRARWMFSLDALKRIRKMKDGEGVYVWQAGITGGIPDRILELPYTTSEFVPKAFSNNNYVGILGDFQYYWIVDALDMTIQRLVELYAESNQTGFIGRYEGDGMPVLEEAFVRVKLATS